MKRFSPPWWAWLSTLLAVSFFGALAQWQWQRGQHKADMIAARSHAAQQPAPLVTRATDLPQTPQRIVLSGEWARPRQEVLLDNQTHQQRVGVHVWTPLRLATSGELVLVDRGWVETSPYRDQLPDTGALPPGSLQLSGWWRGLPEPGLALSPGSCEPATQWPQRLSYPTGNELRCRYDQELVAGLLLLDPDEPDGFVRNWSQIGLPPERHTAYAVQWAALALTAVALLVVLNWKKSRDA